MVFGAGLVGMRKALYLFKEADVVIVDRQPCEVPAGIRFIRGEVLDNLHLIGGTDLVVAATGDTSTDDVIFERARVQGKPCNRSDRPGDFLIPSVVEKRNYTIAVSTLGRSPGMSRYIRLLLERDLSASIEDMVDLSERLREELRETFPDPADREGRIRRMLENRHVWEALARDQDEVREIAKEAVK